MIMMRRSDCDGIPDRKMQNEVGKLILLKKLCQKMFLKKALSLYPRKYLNFGRPN